MGALEELGKATQWWTAPTYPKDKSTVQAIVDIYSNPCDAPWFVYVETALPALGIALLEYLDFGVMDVVRGVAKPAQMNRRSHGRRRRRKRSYAPALPDIGDSIGKKLRPDAFYKRNLSDGQRHLWKIYGRLQTGLWWWMVADIASNFAYNWASAIYSEAHCSRKDDFRGARNASNFLTLFPNTREGLSGGTVDYWEPGPPPLLSWGVTAPAGRKLSATIAGSYIAENPANPPQGVELGFSVTPSANVGRAVADHGQRHGDETHMVASVSAPSGIALAPYTRYTGGGRPRWTNVQLVWSASRI